MRCGGAGEGEREGGREGGREWRVVRESGESGGGREGNIEVREREGERQAIQRIKRQTGNTVHKEKG